MKRILTLSLIPALLAGCTVPSLGIGTTPPNTASATAPLAGTAIDEEALKTTWAAFDLALDTVDMLVVAKIIKPGSPKALRIRAYILATKSSLDAATDLALALNDPLKRLSPAEVAAKVAQYKLVMAKAKTALADARIALNAN